MFPLGEAPVHSPRLRVELLEQRAQLQRRPLASVRQDRHRDVVVVVDLPARDEDRDARNALQPALALVAAFALARDQLPTNAGAWSGIILLGDEAAAGAKRKFAKSRNLVGRPDFAVLDASCSVAREFPVERLRNQEQVIRGWPNAHSTRVMP